MNKELSGKGYIKGGRGFFIASNGERYDYHDGELTRTAAAEPAPSDETIEMNYCGTFELQPLYDGHKSFYGKAFVERWDTGNGTRYVLRSYGTVVARVTPTSAYDAVQETYRVEVGMKHLSRTTLRHVKEFLAQTDDVFKGITLQWLRRTIEDGGAVDGGRKAYVLKEL